MNLCQFTGFFDKIANIKITKTKLDATGETWKAQTIKQHPHDANCILVKWHVAPSEDHLDQLKDPNC